MGIKGKNIKSLIINLIIISIFFIISNALLISYNNRLINDSINNKLSSIIYVVLESNPNIDEKEIIKILNSTNQDNLDILKKYGIDINEESLILQVNKITNEAYAQIFLVSITFIGFIFLIVLRYIYQENKKIDSITKLINDINNKIYKIGILDEEEDNLSNLRNEIYKTSMMLKIDAEDSKKVKESVLKSVADISHQLKTPLSSISIMLDNILDNPSIDLEIKNDYLKKSQNQITSINNLIVNLLKVSKMDAGCVKFKKESINVQDMLNNTRESLSINLELKNIKMNIKCKKDIFITGDLNWEMEAIKNIIKNAIDASFEDSSIDITVNENNFYVSLMIQDYGKGINKKDIKNIFERFYKQNDDSNSFGIGLNLAKMIIEQDNGLISVESEINKGTTFAIKYMKW